MKPCEKVNPALIYASISGYGRTGPYADKGGYDLIAQGMSGLMSVTGEAGRAPAKSGGPVCDINAGILGALGVVSAYVHRLKTGEGQLVDTSLFEAGIQQMYWQAAIYFATGEVARPDRVGAHPLRALPGVPRRRRLAQHRRREPGELGAPVPRARRARLARRIRASPATPSA